jgi:hypothetical protein
VYTEFFASGTQPTDICDLHPRPGIFAQVASVFGGGRDKPEPPRLEETGLPTVVEAVGTTSVPEPPSVETAPEPPKRKRGFWSRIFRRGGDDDDDGDDNDQKERPREERNERRDRNQSSANR